MNPIQFNNNNNPNINNNVLTIVFNANTINGRIIENMIYSPSMSNPQLYTHFPNILFIPTIKLTAKLFGDNMSDDDMKKLFLSPGQFNQFISFVKEKYNIKPITIKRAEDLGIIRNNIQFILNLFFKKNSSLFLNDKQFTINNYRWDQKYDLMYVEDNIIPQTSVNIDIVLHEGKQLSFIDSTRLNCQQQQKSIMRDYYKLVGLQVPKNTLY